MILNPGLAATLLFTLGFLLTATSLSAQEPAELITDRPDQTESAVVVPVETWQLEMGWIYSREDEGGVRRETWEVPGTLLRYGLSERFELRLGWSGWIDEEVEVGGRRFRNDGGADAEVGFKLQLRRGQERGPDVALLASTSLPTAEDGLGAEDAEPSVAVLISHALTPKVGLGYNLGVRRISGIEEDLTEGFYTVALGRPFSPRLGGFVEIFGNLPEGGGGTTSLDGGLTWLVAPRFQLDAFVGTGLEDEAEDFFAGIGFSVRWPR